MKNARRRWLLGGVAFIFLYLVGFLVLWLGGGYVLNQSGMTRDTSLTGFPFADTADWQPLFGNCQPKYQWPGAAADWTGGDVSPRCDAIGWTYYPLWILIKKKHPTYALLDKDGLPYDTINPDDLPDGFGFHPLRGNELRDSFDLINGETPNKAVVPSASDATSSLCSGEFDPALAHL